MAAGCENTKSPPPPPAASLVDGNRPAAVTVAAVPSQLLDADVLPGGGAVARDPNVDRSLAEPFAVSECGRGIAAAAAAAAAGCGNMSVVRATVPGAATSEGRFNAALRLDRCAGTCEEWNQKVRLGGNRRGSKAVEGGREGGRRTWVAAPKAAMAAARLAASPMVTLTSVAP